MEQSGGIPTPIEYTTRRRRRHHHRARGETGERTLRWVYIELGHGQCGYGDCLFIYVVLLLPHIRQKSQIKMRGIECFSLDFYFEQSK